MSLNDPPVTILCPANPANASPVSFTFSASWVAVISSSLLNATAVPNCLLRVVFDFIKFVVLTNISPDDAAASANALLCA